MLAALTTSTSCPSFEIKRGVFFLLFLPVSDSSENLGDINTSAISSRILYRIPKHSGMLIN